jgi:hypothetical protein
MARIMPRRSTPRSEASAPAAPTRASRRGRARAASLISLYEGGDKPKRAGIAPLDEKPAGPAAPAAVQAGSAPAERPPAPERAPAATGPTPPAQSVPRAAKPPATAEEMITYWNRLRHGRRFPALADIEASFLIDGWPGAILFECAAAGVEPLKSAPGVLRMSRLGNGAGDVAYTPMVMEWMLSLAREVARTGEAIEDRENFPAAGSVASYRLVLLPLGEERAGVGHVLGAVGRV